jgi:hypothetical protein
MEAHGIDSAMRPPRTAPVPGPDRPPSQSTRGRQITGRCTPIPTQPLPYNTEWDGLVATLEGAFRLRAHPAGSLTALDRYLHSAPAE